MYLEIEVFVGLTSVSLRSQLEPRFGRGCASRGRARTRIGRDCAAILGRVPTELVRIRDCEKSLRHGKRGTPTGTTSPRAMCRCRDCKNSLSWSGTHRTSCVSRSGSVLSTNPLGCAVITGHGTSVERSSKIAGAAGARLGAPAPALGTAGMATSRKLFLGIRCDAIHSVWATRMVRRSVMALRACGARSFKRVRYVARFNSTSCSYRAWARSEVRVGI